MRTFFKLALIILSIFVFSGCGGDSNDTPITPSDDIVFRPINNSDPQTDINQWGTWILRFHDQIGDTEAWVDAIPLRTGEIHLDVKDLLFPPACSNCIDITLMGVVDYDWTLNVELTNPSVMVGYDVMGIFPGENGPGVYFPDGYTDLFDVDGDSLTHHPYILYDTATENNEWGPAESYDRTFMFHRAEGESFRDLIYVIGASWPENQDEVVQLKNPEITGPIYTDASHPQTITVEVIDHQGDIEYVLIDMVPLNGHPYTHMEDIGDGIYQLYNYAEYGLEPGTVDLMIAAKSEGSDYITYNYLAVEIIDPPPPPTYFEFISGPTTLTGDGIPVSEIDLAVVGRTDGTSRTLVQTSGTTVYSWNEDYTMAGLFITLVDTTGDDPDFPIEPPLRIAAADPTDPDSSGTFTILQTNNDEDVWDELSDPVIMYRNLFQLLDMDQLTVTEFKQTADNELTPELDAILRPADVSCGTSSDRFGYALWTPSEGAYPGYYPYVTLVRYEPPYFDGGESYDFLIGGVYEGVGEGKINAEDVNGLAVWDSDGQDELIIAVSEGGVIGEVEIFSANYDLYPETEFTHNMTITELAGIPLDVAILPVGDAGLEDENWVCVLTDNKSVEIFTFSGELIESICNIDTIPSMPSHLDTDLENLRIHVTMSTGPAVTVYEYKGL